MHSSLRPGGPKRRLWTLGSAGHRLELFARARARLREASEGLLGIRDPMVGFRVLGSGFRVDGLGWGVWGFPNVAAVFCSGLIGFTGLGIRQLKWAFPKDRTVPPSLPPKHTKKIISLVLGIRPFHVTSGVSAWWCFGLFDGDRVWGFCAFGFKV